MKLVESRAYTASSMSVEQLLQMNQAEVLQQFPFYAIVQTGPIGKMEEFLQFASRIYQNSQTQPTNNILVWALSSPAVQISVVSEDLSSEGIHEENTGYINTIIPSAFGK